MFYADGAGHSNISSASERDGDCMLFPLVLYCR
ncbi:hypothetical protein HCH_03492 [Hahella chejuensis KCTC 2396]|uniref:Uncharacterized protein n=1 Tax=Hahella chejuensis (strain KCTC 2396) TaxID=349521 RepID=Q2SGI6_HAHCH|nr:hypothetical protein HCH_03492 [Hahella chejuensis KCTC 2396]